MSEMISDSGAVRDVNEIAANDYPEPPRHELPAEISLEDAEVIIAQNDPELFESTGPIDPPEGEEVDKADKLAELSVSLSGSLEQLRSLRHELVATGQISRAEASTIKNIVASAESLNQGLMNLPLNSYTELGSKVNYNATCEGLGSTIYQALLKFAQTVWGYIKSLSRTLLSIITGRQMKNKQYDTVDKAVNTKSDKAAQAPEFGSKLERIAAKYKDGWCTLDTEVIKSRFSQGDSLGLHGLEKFALATFWRAKNLRQDLYTSSAETLVDTDLQYDKLESAVGELNSIANMGLGLEQSGPHGNKYGNALHQWHRHLTLIAGNKRSHELNENTLRELNTARLEYYANYSNVWGLLADGAKILNDTIEFTNNQIKKTPGASDEWIKNRQAAVAALKDIQAMNSLINDCLNTIIKSRDKLSQIKLEMVR